VPQAALGVLETISGVDKAAAGERAVGQASDSLGELVALLEVAEAAEAAA